MLTARFGTYGRGLWDFVVDEDYSIIDGDLNSDLNLNIQDIILLINYILDGSYNQTGDLNEDGNLNVVDVVQLANIILGN